MTSRLGAKWLRYRCLASMLWINVGGKSCWLIPRSRKYYQKRWKYLVKFLVDPWRVDSTYPLTPNFFADLPSSLAICLQILCLLFSSVSSEVCVRYKAPIQGPFNFNKRLIIMFARISTTLLYTLLILAAFSNPIPKVSLSTPISSCCIHDIIYSGPL